MHFLRMVKLNNSKKLWGEKREQKIHKKLLNEKASVLYEKAMKLIIRVELGEFNEKQMKGVEYAIAHYLAAIEDIQKVKLLELTM